VARPILPDPKMLILMVSNCGKDRKVFFHLQYLPCGRIRK
jgi:hypothetical protein